MAEEWDRIVEEIASKKGRQEQDDQWQEDVRPEIDRGTIARIQDERKEKVASFQLNLDLGEEEAPVEPATEPISPAVPTADELTRTLILEPAVLEEAQDEAAPFLIEPPEMAGTVEMPVQTDAAEPPALSPDVKNPPLTPEPDNPEKTEKKAKKRKRKVDPQRQAAWGCFRSILYVTLVIAVSITMACFLIIAGIDVTGLNKSGTEVEVTIERGSGTKDVAEALKEAGIIDQPWIFMAFSKLTKSDGTYMPGTFKLSADMGYSNVIQTLQQGVKRETVRVTIPEGYTIDRIASLLEEQKVCTASDFYDAVQNGDYSSYDFVASIPTKETNEKYADRLYRLEGYLFPDTYEFYTGSTGDTVVRKLLDNFGTRIGTNYRSKIAAKGMTIDDVVVLASVVQGEASDGEWSRVARVLQNRIDKPGEFPKLECDATYVYVKNINRDVLKVAVNEDAYDTSVCKGLPAGAIGNPGLNAFDAVLSPSADPAVVNCYYFATDVETGITYYSKTYAEHVKICKQYGIGIYGNS